MSEDAIENDPSVTQDEADITPTISDVEVNLEEDLNIAKDRIAQLEAFQKSDAWEDEVPHEQKVVISEYLIHLRAIEGLLSQFFPG